MKPHKISLLVWLYFLILGVVFLIYKFSITSWSTFVSNGEITGQIFTKNNMLIYGTNYTKLYFLDLLNSANVQTLDLNSGDVLPQEVRGDNTLVISGDTLWVINTNSKKTVWHTSNENQFIFQKAVFYKNYVLAGSVDGSLTAFGITDGRVLWKFVPKPIENLSNILSTGKLYYFGGFTYADNYVYLESMDRTFYALDLKTGSVVWKTDISDLPVTGPDIYGRYLFIGTSSGKSIALDRYTGKIIWQTTSDSSVKCSKAVSAFSVLDIPQLQILGGLSEYLKKWFSLGPLAYFELHQDGTVDRRDGKTGAIVWKTDTLGSGLNCPTFWKSRGLFTGIGGDFIALSLNSGKKLLQRSNLGAITNSVVVKPKFEKYLLDLFSPFAPDYFVNNTTGDLFLINGNTGKVSWKFSTSAPTTSGTLPVLNGKSVFFATSDGVIYKLNLSTGLPDLNYNDQRFDVTQSVTKVSKVNIFELTLKSYGNFLNPWREADLRAVFTHESGKVIEISGFYYDQNQWKVRFNPPIKGKWTWKMLWSPHGKTLSKTGELNADTDTSGIYLHTTTTNPKRLTLDEKTVFNGIGLGDTMLDFNGNGTPLDDWAIGNSSPVIATNSSGITSTYKSDKIITLTDYIATYGPMGAGFNMFRWNPENASNALWRDFGFPTVYFVSDGKIADKFLETLKDNDIHVWSTFFYNMPFRFSNDPNQIYLIDSYIKYVVARYGVYTDIWELANEITIPEGLMTTLRNEIELSDYLHHPISTTSEDQIFDKADIIAPHWYESEDIGQSDIKTSNLINQYADINKPVVVAEQGNKDVNFDSTSAIRMRIRAWTSFFEGGILMFWNQSDSKNSKTGLFPNANIYLGEVERSYVRVLQNYSQAFPLDSKNIQYALDNFGVRGYGLNSARMQAGYFYHYFNPFTFTRFSLVLTTKHGGELQWIDPSTGNIIQKDQCPAVICTITSPPFKTDISFQLK